MRPFPIQYRLVGFSASDENWSSSVSIMVKKILGNTVLLKSFLHIQASELLLTNYY